MLNFAFLGCGHIAKSLIQGFQKNKDIKIFGYDILEQNKEWLEKNNHSSCSLEECIAKSDIIFLCVKPQDLKTLCDEIMEFNISSKTFVSVAAGVKISELENFLPNNIGKFKGMGEGGTIGATGAIANAVSDALKHLNIEITELPITPNKLYNLISNKDKK